MLTSRPGALLPALVAVAVTWGPPEPATAAAVADRPVGVLSPLNGDGPTLARLDPLSLRPVGPRVRLGEYHDAWSFSPDRSRLALGMGGQGDPCGRGICIVDVGSMRIAGYVAAPIAVEALAWLSPRRIVAVLQRGGILVADPVSGTIVRRRPLPFSPGPPASARTPGGLAVLMGGRPPRLVVMNAEGRVRTAALRRFPSRFRAAPGLAVDRRGRRALAFAAGAPVAEIDLRTMRVRHHRVALPRPTRAPPGRVRSTHREALWLGRGLVAVSGDDHLSGPDGAFRGGETFAAGVQLVDTENWTARTVEPHAGRALLAAGRLLVYTPEGFRPRSAAIGLRVYSRDGRHLVSHLLGNRALDVEVAGGRAYAYPVSGRSRALHVVRARSGDLIRRAAPPPRGLDVEILDG